MPIQVVKQNKLSEFLGRSSCFYDMLQVTPQCLQAVVTCLSIQMENLNVYEKLQ